MGPTLHATNASLDPGFAVKTLGDEDNIGAARRTYNTR